MHVKGRDWLMVMVIALTWLWGPGIAPVLADADQDLSAPTALHATGLGAHAITMQWQCDSTHESGYNIERKGPGEASFRQVGTVSANRYEFTDSGLQPNSQYSYRVYAYNDWDNTPAYSNVIQAKTTDTEESLSAPFSLYAGNVEQTLVRLNWRSDSAHETGYNIERKGPGEASFKQAGTVSANKYQYTDSGLRAGTTYSYRVYAYNDWDNTPAYSNVVTVTTKAGIIDMQLSLPPAAPSNLIGGGGFDSASLEWQDNANNEASFVIERREPGASPFKTSFSQVGTVGANITNYTDTGLALGATYAYRIKARNSAGDSAYSNTVSITTRERAELSRQPNAPNSLMAEQISSAGVVLAWEDQASNEDGFSLERAAEGGGFAELADLEANAESYIDEAVTAGAAYRYRVRAYNDDGKSRYSNVLAVNIPDETPDTETPYTETPGQGETGETSQPAITLVYTINNPSYIWNDTAQAMDVAPIVRDGRTLLPIRYVANPLGAQTKWDSGEGKVTIISATKTIELLLNQNTARVNDVSVMIDPANPNVMPISIPPGRTMMPLRFIADNLDCQVAWDAATSRVIVTYPR